MWNKNNNDGEEMMQNHDLEKSVSKYNFGEKNYQDLMRHKVHEILLVSTFYDAFVFEQDGILSEHFFGEYDQLSLGNIPRITSVSNGTEALQMLDKKWFDVIIIMMRIGDFSPYELSRKIKDKYPGVPVLLLLNVESDIELINRNADKMHHIDDVFLWHGDSKIFLAMIKYVEDKLNVKNDTKDGLVNVILLVEDSVRYYSRFLPLLYTEIMRQTQRLISAEMSVLNKRRRMRIRPKVLLVHNYEDAIEVLQKYKDEIICTISDVKYPKNEVMDGSAGMQLMKLIKQESLDIALMLQSSDLNNAELAVELGVQFLHKNSDTLLLDLRKFILRNLGFGDLVFRNEKNVEIARASNLLEFEALLPKVPAETILFHASRNHFSAWLIAHGEMQVAKRIKPLEIDNFTDPEEIREFLIDTFQEIRMAKNKGKVIEFDKNTIDPEGQVIRLCDGSLGGKGRGLAFLNSLIFSMGIDSWFENVSIRTPKTFIISTNEFDLFLDNNEIKKAILDLPFDKDQKSKEWQEQEDAVSMLQKITASDDEIKSIFLKGELSEQLISKLEHLLSTADYPLAVRSSGLLEDSQSQPFAGIYNTYMLPNNEVDMNRRMEKLMIAIKLVFASVFLKDARRYIKNINYKVEEEKIAKQKLSYVYLGNVTTDRSTYCPKCRTLLIKRDYYIESLIQNSKCPSCGKTIYGSFE